MAEQRQDDQLAPIYCSSVRIWGVEDLPEAINDKDGWRKRVGDICADGMTR